MNYICTWICVDEKGEESYFPQTGKLSSSAEHHAIYWRCMLTFFLTSIRFNKQHQHLLFTNARSIPVVDGHDISSILDELNVEVIFTDFKYKTPAGYFFSFQNQFYEFSILEHIAERRRNTNDSYLILDSDCVFLRPATKLFAAAAETGFISFEDDVQPDYVINGLSRNDLKEIYEELLNERLATIPGYHLGEFFLASYENIERISKDFEALWPILLERHATAQKKFNEEAHTLSYLYFKNGLKAGERDSFMKRIWTNPTFYRNVEPQDVALTIWHLPAEKTYGLRKLYNLFTSMPEYGEHMSDNEYLERLKKITGIPLLKTQEKWKYYTSSYYRAIKKRVLKIPKLMRAAAST